MEDARIMILYRYIIQHVLFATFLVLGVLMGLETFLELINELSDFSAGSFGFLSVLYYVLLQIPADLYELFPIAGLLGGMIGLGWLAASHELEVMRASGFSIAQLFLAVCAVAVLWLLPITLMGEYVAPGFEKHAEQLKQAASSADSLSQEALNNLWLKQGAHFIHVDHATATHQAGISDFELDALGGLHGVGFAQRAHNEATGWVWNDFKNAKLPTFSDLDQHPLERVIQTTRVPVNKKEFVFNPTLLKIENNDIRHQSLTTLWHNVHYRRELGLDTQALEFTFWQRLLQPVSTLVMICLGIPFILGPLRATNRGGRMLGGIFVAFVFYMLHQFLGPVSLVYQLPPVVAALLPSVLFAGVGFYLLQKVK